MNTKRCYRTVLMLPAVLFSLGILSNAAVGDQDPLPSWNDGTAKQSIIDFVNRVTQFGSPDFVEPEQRIATFDNDGCCWNEKPAYIQLSFALTRPPNLGRAISRPFSLTDETSTWSRRRSFWPSSRRAGGGWPRSRATARRW